MTNYKDTYNLYCDESRVENIDSNKMTIGVIEIPRYKKNEVTNCLKNIFFKHSFFYELKWTKVNKRFLPMYKELVDYFFNQALLSFRCIVIDKRKVKLKDYHNNDEELAFFKFYYLLLKEKLLSGNKYYIFLDKKPTRDKNRARALLYYLDSFVILHRNKCTIKALHPIESDENRLIQMTDFFVGLMGYACNNQKLNFHPKDEIAEYLIDKLNFDNICETTPLNFKKFNIFIWDGNEKNR